MHDGPRADVFLPQDVCDDVDSVAQVSSIRTKRKIEPLGHLFLTAPGFEIGVAQGMIISFALRNGAQKFDDVGDGIL